jgi:hypothetical protein
VGQTRFWHLQERAIERQIFLCAIFRRLSVGLGFEKSLGSIGEPGWASITDRSARQLLFERFKSWCPKLKRGIYDLRVRVCARKPVAEKAFFLMTLK